MPLNQSRMRSQLAISADRLRLLNKIKTLYTQKASRLVFEKAGARFNAKDCSNVALDFDAADDNIIFTRPTGPVIFASKVIQDLTYTAVAAGADGNDITIEYVDDGTADAETVDVTGTAIVVHIESGVSTATQVKAAIDAESTATDLVSVAISGTAGDPQVTAAAANLEDGSDTEQYDTADILMIKRLRTKKYLIIIKDAADEAQAS